MSELTSETASPAPNPAQRMLALLWRPRVFFSSEQKKGWGVPMLVLTLTLALQVIVGGYFRAQAALMGSVELPADWEWWTPEMQNNFMQAQQATTGPVFVYVIPLVGALSSLWLGWLIVSGLLHLTSTLLGGRGNMGGALYITAWASLPLALRDILRIIFMLAAGRAISSPGLSGFVGGSETCALFAGQLLGLVDVFFVWYAVLMAIGVSVSDKLGMRKAGLGVAGVLILILLGQAGLGVLGRNLGSMLISRPFF